MPEGAQSYILLIFFLENKHVGISSNWAQKNVAQLEFYKSGKLQENFFTYLFYEIWIPIATILKLRIEWQVLPWELLDHPNIWSGFYELLNISILPAFYICRLKLSLTQQRITFAESQLQSNWKSLSQHPIPDWELCSLGSIAVVSYYQKKIRIHYNLIIP